jgi:hypothetical protein
MKLINIYLIKRTPECRTRWDENSAFVIAAKNARQCREIASKRDHGDEDREIWRNPKLTSIRKIGVSAKENPHIILRDYHAG